MRLGHFAEVRGQLTRRTNRNGLAWAGLLLCVLGIGASAGLGVVYYKGAKKLLKEVKGDLAELDLTFEKWKGATATDFTVTAVNGDEIKLESLRGRRVMLYFLNSWSPTCDRVNPHIAKLRSEVSTNELVIVGIGTEDAGTLRAFAKKEHLDIPLVSTSKLPRPYDHVFMIPTMFFIDRKGVLQEVLLGDQEFETLKGAATHADYEGDPKPPPATQEKPEAMPEPEKTQI